MLLNIVLNCIYLNFCYFVKFLIFILILLPYINKIILNISNNYFTRILIDQKFNFCYNYVVIIIYIVFLFHFFIKSNLCSLYSYP